MLSEGSAGDRLHQLSQVLLNVPISLRFLYPIQRSVFL